MSDERFRKLLIDRREELVRQLDSTRDRMINYRDGVGELSVADNHLADVASDLTDRGRELGARRQLQAQFHAVTDALNRIDEGRFGVCETCGSPIGRARLEAIPETRFCRPCSDRNRDLWTRPPEEDVLADRIQERSAREQALTGQRLLSELEEWGMAGDRPTET